ncbi:MICOS complex subunit MIC25 isoform X2 [Notamacropus eugenii]|uniref:MICOS complex subunit MIC25 isoform X2 n=1 Tax=Notamacropus eugenii TaxID=9315 RepID=UPI003B681A90
MGSTESTPRKVSFGMDEDEQVRVLQGIRLSEDVVNRMKDPSASSRVQQPSPASPPSASTSTSPPPPSFSHSSSFAFGSSEDPKPPKAENQSSRQPSEAEEDLYRRYEQEQAMIQEELLQLVKREREVSREHLKSSLPWEKSDVNQEKQRSAQLAKELEVVEAELRRRDIFYKEQLGRIERKNAEMYKLSSQQFHEAATQLEDTIKPRGAEPVCSGLQSQILHCYRDNLREVLKCSDLVKAYQHCVNTAHKFILSCKRVCSVQRSGALCQTLGIKAERKSPCLQTADILLEDGCYLYLKDEGGSKEMAEEQQSFLAWREPGSGRRTAEKWAHRSLVHHQHFQPFTNNVTKKHHCALNLS